MTVPTPAARLTGLTAYTKAKSPVPIELKLDGNEGACPDRAILAEIAAAPAEILRRYPDATELEQLLAARVGVAPDQLLVTAGGDEALDRICRAFAEPGRNLVMPTPTFEMLPRYAALAGAEARRVSWLRGAFPVATVLEAVDAATSIVFVVSPNNPTGLCATVDDLERLADGASHALIVVDAAYTEFAGVDLTPTATRLPNAVVVRTLSKAFGLAGLRVGYAIGPPEVIGELRKAASPYPVSGVALWLAERFVASAEDAVDAYIERVRLERVRLAEVARSNGFEAWPSEGNFVMVRGRNAAKLHVGLRDRGIAVRAFGDEELRDCLRITCPGDEVSFERLTTAIEEVLR